VKDGLDSGSRPCSNLVFETVTDQVQQTIEGARLTRNHGVAMRYHGARVSSLVAWTWISAAVPCLAMALIHDASTIDDATRAPAATIAAAVLTGVGAWMVRPQIERLRLLRRRRRDGLLGDVPGAARMRIQPGATSERWRMNSRTSESGFTVDVEFAGAPCFVGGRLVVELLLTQKSQRDAAVKGASLLCIRESPRPALRGSWDVRCERALGPVAHGVDPARRQVYAVEFDVPVDARGTDLLGIPTIHWKLAVWLDAPSGACGGMVEAPVFARPPVTP